MAGNGLPGSTNPGYCPDRPQAQLFRLRETEDKSAESNGAEWRRIVVDRFQLHLGSQNFFTLFSIVILISKMFRRFSLPRFPITNRLVCIGRKIIFLYISAGVQCGWISVLFFFKCLNDVLHFFYGSH